MNVRRKAFPLALLALIGSVTPMCGCTTSQHATNEATVVQYAPMGVAQADLQAGLEQQRRDIVGCLRKRGFEYTHPAVKPDGASIFTGVGPVRDQQDRLRNPRAYEEGVSKDDKKIPKGLAEAYEACRAETEAAKNAKLAAVKPLETRLLASWAAFQKSDRYGEAAKAYRSCMQGSGYDVDSVDATETLAGKSLDGFYTAWQRDHGNAIPAPQDLDSLVPGEVKLQTAARSCYGQHFAPVMQEYARRLQATFGDQLAAYVKAYRS